MANWTSSLWGGRIALDPTQWADDDPMSTALGRQVVNNADHLADAYSQPRVCMPLVAAANGFSEATLSSDATAPTEIVRFGPFPLSLREDGSPKRLRVRLAGASIKAGSGVTFVVRVHPAGSDPAESHTAMTTANTTSATEAWLADAAGTNLIMLDTLDVAAALVERTTRTALAGDVTGITWALFEATVYAYQLSATQEASLCGLSIAELRGEP